MGIVSKAQVGHPGALTAVVVIVVLLSVDPNMMASGQRVLLVYCGER